MLSTEKTGRGIPLLALPPVSRASSSGLHAFPKLATSQNSSRNTTGEWLMTCLVGSCASGSSSVGVWMQHWKPHELFQGKFGIHGMRGPGLAPTCNPQPCGCSSLGSPGHSSTKSREQPGWAWRNEDLVFWDEGWREEGTQEGCSASAF